MVTVRRKLAFSRTATIPKDNRYEHSPRSGRKVRILVERGGSAKHGVTRGLIKNGCSKLDMQVYFIKLSLRAYTN